ncbi:hypothetical protein RRU01S_15_00710 [Agrobacterium rubi TR3 = NBRC 13261]|uniref:DUF4747 family protein n=1 Tax=Agrobacterium rubi TR3 = NBRC 13261 TaxID=1368415 RepID=A0A081CWV0_9HYPH|nr:DUF4747 family protein [Agrobacterium rubi]MBP1878113.1 hypothetical protein [Agrobacterium rubi]GAK71146.1 hypothetical protein RRU01S_15_00710 [Agrobacterium rubi TR3 = NBRC 13261]
MARKIKVSASALNIRLHPHEQGTYSKWLRTVYRKRIIGPVHGDRHGMISSLDTRQEIEGIVTGLITTFVKFDKDAEWFNSAELKEATEDELSEIEIPPDLHYNPAYFYFALHEKTHKLYFQTYSKGDTLTPLSAKKFFGYLAKNIDVMREFGEAQISLVQEKASLERMFEIDRITEISITIAKPNTDIFDDDFDKNIENHLAETHSRAITISYKADAGGSIQPDDDIRKISNVALSNGSVEVKGRDEKGAVKLNSEDYPLELHDKYDPDAKQERSAFLALLPIFGAAFR